MKALFNSILCASVLLASCIPAGMAQTLVGGITVNDSLPQSPPSRLVKMSGEKYDKTAPAVQRPKDCICINYQFVEAKQVNGSWKVVEGDHWIMDFQEHADEAQMAAKTIRTYKMTDMCFVGRGTARPMMFFLSDGAAPVGKVDGEDKNWIDPEQVKAEEIDGRWKITCGTIWMEDFDKNAEIAKEGAALIKLYGFNRHCFVGRPGAPMEYFTRD